MVDFTVFLDGEFFLTPRLEALIAGSRCIVADGGARHALSCGIEPELWIGDFDSSAADLYIAFQHIPRLVFPRDKKETDSELAVEECLRRGASSILLAGAFGGERIDHIFFHLSYSLNLARQNIKILLAGFHQEATPLLPGNWVFDYSPGTSFSILPFSNLKNISVNGARWSLSNDDVPLGSSRTLSNVVTGTLKISFDEGAAVLFAIISG